MKVTIRPARIADASAIARVHVASWRSTYPGMLPDKFLVNLSAPTQTERWRRLLRDTRQSHGTYVVSLAQHGVVGFGSCGRQRTALDGFSGEFYTIYLLDEVQGLGIGRHLLGTMAAELIDDGVNSAVVWVLADNPARWFYERLGGAKVAEVASRFAGRQIAEVAYGWRDLEPLSRLSTGPRVK